MNVNDKFDNGDTPLDDIAVDTSLDTDVDDDDVVERLVRFRVHFDVADLLHDIHALGDPTKHGVFTIKPRL